MEVDHGLLSFLGFSVFGFAGESEAEGGKRVSEADKRAEEIKACVGSTALLYLFMIQLERVTQHRRVLESYEPPMMLILRSPQCISPFSWLGPKCTQNTTGPHFLGRHYWTAAEKW